MNIKDVTSMLRKNEMAALAKFILSGKNIQGACFMHVVDQLAVHGVNKKMLIDRGAIISLEELLKNLHAYPINKSDDIDSRRLLKHYHYVLSTTLQLWQDNQLQSEPLLCSDLDNRVVRNLKAKWQNHLANGRIAPSAYVAHLESCVTREVEQFASAIKSGVPNGKITDVQIEQYTSLVQDKILNDWKHNSTVEFSAIKLHLDKKLIEILLQETKANKLGAVLQQVVDKHLRDAITNHVSILCDFEKFTGLNERSKSIAKGFQEVNCFKDYTKEIIDTLMKNFGEFSGQAGKDIDTILNNEVLPLIIKSNDVTVLHKQAAVCSLIQDQRKRLVHPDFGNYVQRLINHTLYDEIRADISQDQKSFKGVLEKIILADIIDLKCGSKVLREIMPQPAEYFSDIMSLMSQIQFSVNTVGRMSDLEREYKTLSTNYTKVCNTNEQLLDQHVLLTKKVEELTVMLISVVESQQTTKPAQAASWGSNLKFFGKNPPDAADKQDGPKPK